METNSDRMDRDTAVREDKADSHSRPPSTHAVATGKVRDTNSEYLHFLELNDRFSGERLQKLVRKVDWHVLPQLILIYLMSYIDRTNVGNAKLFGVETDLGLSSQQWNTCLSIFFVTYALAGVPSNIALKRFGPKIWLPALLLSVSCILVFTSLQVNFAGWAAFRVILGVFEAGVFPGCSFVLTSWYSPREVHSRMAIFYSGASAAGAFSGLLAYGIGQLDHTWGYRGWRFIYCIEGLFTVLLSISAFWFVHDTPAKVGKWLTPEEKEFLILRHKYSAGGETGVAEKSEFSWKHAGMAFKSLHIYAVTLIEFTLCVTVYGYSFVLPTIISNLGYSNANAQAMTVPPYVFACLVTTFSGWAADRYQQRMLSVLLPNLMALCGFIIMLVSSRYPSVPGVTLLGVFLTTGGLYPISPAVTAWISLNCAGTMKRAVGIGAMISFSQLGGIVGSNIYISNQSPTYPVGFGISLGMLAVFGCIWPVIYYIILKRINAKRAAMDENEIRAKYTDEQLSDMGDMSPLFRYAT
ncbi:major facilitator superfamily domain-containing protein [Aspergillus californicus]